MSSERTDRWAQGLWEERAGGAAVREMGLARLSRLFRGFLLAVSKLLVYHSALPAHFQPAVRGKLRGMGQLMRQQSQAVIRLRPETIGAEKDVLPQGKALP